MVFWFLIAAVVILVILQIVSHVLDWYWGQEFGFGIAAIAVAVIGMIVVGTAVSAYPPKWQLTSTHELRALVTKDQTESHGEAVFFLGFGYASSSTEEVTSVSYIETAKDGGNTLHKVDIDSSVIYEGTESPFVDDYTKVHAVDDYVWVPWTMSWNNLEVQHRFHIPTGSIFKGYEVNP